MEVIKVYNISLTEQEVTVLVQLIDIAVKAGGLQVAESAVILSKKLQAAKLSEIGDSNI